MAPDAPETLSTAGPDSLVDDIVATREALRVRARATLGVVGNGATIPLVEVRRRYGLSYYPLAALSILFFTDGFQTYAFQVLAPDISRALGISIGSIGAAVALDTLAVAVAPIPVAWLSQWPKRRALLCLTTGFAWSVLTLFTGFVTAFAGLLFILVVDGLTTGSVTALHLPLLMDSYHPAARMRVVSRYSAAGFVASVIAPLIVAFFAGEVGLTWRGVFLAMGLTSVGLTLLCLGLRDPGFGQWDTDRLRAALRQAKDEDVRHTSGGDVPLGFWEIVHRLTLIPTLRRVFAAFVLVGVLSVPLATFISFYLQERWGLDAGQRGLFFAYYAAASAVSLLIYGGRGEKLFRSSPSKVPRLIGALLALAVSFIALGGAVPSFLLVLVCFGIAGAAIGPLLPSLYISSLSIIPSRMRPHAQALTGVFLAIGGVVGSVFYAGIDKRYGIDGSMIAVAIPGLIGAWVITDAARHIGRDLDRMIDDIVEEEEIKRIRAGGGHLPMLSCRGLNFSYDKLQVLFDVDFTVDDGEMVALLGVNGAGKSTLLKVISGIGLAHSGSIRFSGSDITYLDAERRVGLGITQVPGGRAVFGPMTVLENLRTFGFTQRRDRRSLESAIERSFAAFPGLDDRRASLASTLSGGEQQMLALSKALILQPRLLLIDELSLGLAPLVVAQLLDMVRQINAEGTAVVLVEQSVNIALNLVNHAYFMEKGEIRFDGAASELLRRDDLLRAVFLRGVETGT